MGTSSDKNSARYYPWDMLILLYSPLPMFAMMMLIGSLSFLTDAEKTFALSVASLLSLAGVILIAKAKWPLYRAGVYTSFGLSAIPSSHRTYYKWGMGLVVTGCALFVALAF